HAYVCEQCLLVQLEEFESPEKIFSNYAYFSSYSDSWLAHAKKYTDHIIKNFDIVEKSQVIEIASNDGYLLQYFNERNIPVLGIEPAGNVAEVAVSKGIPTLNAFFGVETANMLANKGKQADLLLGNNVLAHVPDINDFVQGMKIILKPGGFITMEFPHLLKLMEGVQFDTIYHEHFSYFSLMTVLQIFSKHGLSLFDIEELDTHGGSLRIYAQHTDTGPYKVKPGIDHILEQEEKYGMKNIDTYTGFIRKVLHTKNMFLQFLLDASQQGKQVAAYGAPAKGNTLLNFCGIRADLIQYTVDRSPYKQGLFLPGSHIPVEAPDKLKQTKPDYIVILPWNLRDEIIEQASYVREWGAKFVVPVPEVLILA
ncbi:MAG: methyltransferase domain-containing protein, partial [Gammaproteobacteria bacterium]|nr:methyltransferase domain-containing protein [Gammaproteobacteria bacterium]